MAIFFITLDSFILYKRVRDVRIGRKHFNGKELVINRENFCH